MPYNYESKLGISTGQSDALTSIFVSGKIVFLVHVKCTNSRKFLTLAKVREKIVGNLDLK